MPKGMRCIATATATPTANKYAACQTVLQMSTYCLSCVQPNFTITEGSDISCADLPP